MPQRFCTGFPGVSFKTQRHSASEHFHTHKFYRRFSKNRRRCTSKAFCGFMSLTALIRLPFPSAFSSRLPPSNFQLQRSQREKQRSATSCTPGCTFKLRTKPQTSALTKFNLFISFNISTCYNDILHADVPITRVTTYPFFTYFCFANRCSDGENGSTGTSDEAVLIAIYSLFT